MSYKTLNDSPSDDERAFAACNIVSKFCTFGMVTSQKWYATYLTILDGIVRIYDTRESCVDNEHSDIQRIVLNSTGRYRTSKIKTKNYSNDPMKIIDLHCFNIEIDNGLFAPTKLIKIGCYSMADAKRLTQAIRLATSSGDDV